MLCHTGKPTQEQLLPLSVFSLKIFWLRLVKVSFLQPYALNMVIGTATYSFKAVKIVKNQKKVSLSSIFLRQTSQIPHILTQKMAPKNWRENLTQKMARKFWRENKRKSEVKVSKTITVETC